MRPILVEELRPNKGGIDRDFRRNGRSWSDILVAEEQASPWERPGQVIKAMRMELFPVSFIGKLSES
jgi:hypothetical protein